MHCLNHIEHAKIPNDIIKLYLQTYPYIGRNHEMMHTVETDKEALIEHTIKQDAFYFSQLFKAPLSDSRYRQILTKDTQPKNKDELFVARLKQAFLKMHHEAETFDLIHNEIYDLLRFLFQNIDTDQSLQFAKMEKNKRRNIDLLASSYTSKREMLIALIDRYKAIIKNQTFESGFVITNFYIDFINIKPFVKHNETIGLLLLYLLQLVQGYRCYHLSSFFEKIHKQKIVFFKHQKDASHNWHEGLSNTMNLHRFLLEIAVESYKDVSETIRNYTFDHQFNKSDYIENTINRLDEVFTKEDIREAHPTVSDSTINRTLKRMREENKIRPLGKGRSAKWMKLYKSPKKRSFQEQLTLKL